MHGTLAAANTALEMWSTSSMANHQTGGRRDLREWTNPRPWHRSSQPTQRSQTHRGAVSPGKGPPSGHSHSSARCPRGTTPQPLHSPGAGVPPSPAARRSPDGLHAPLVVVDALAPHGAEAGAALRARVRGRGQDPVWPRGCEGRPPWGRRGDKAPPDVWDSGGSPKSLDCRDLSGFVEAPPPPPGAGAPKLKMC